MRAFRDISIKRKLMLIMMLTSIVVLLLALASFVTNELITFRQEMIENLSTLADVIGSNSTAALIFNDKEAAGEILAALKAKPNIRSAKIYNKEGEPFAEHFRGKGVEHHAPIALHQDFYADEGSLSPQSKEGHVWGPPKAMDEGHTFHEGYLDLWKRIVLDEETIGTIYVCSDLQELYSRLRLYVSVGALVTLVSIFLAFLLSSRLQGVISKPILNLADTMRVVSKDKDYSIRVERQSNDELGIMIDGFNEMLEQIQVRDAKLELHRNYLEELVSERTAELQRANTELQFEISERKRAEAQKEALMKELEMSNEKLKQSNQQLQDFVYVASHDLREPLRKISAFGRILADSLKGKLDEDQQENLGFLIDGANRMQQMTDALLTYSRVTTKAKPHHRVDLNEVICDLRDLELASQLEETDGTIEVPQSLPAVFADSTQMHQLLQNLIGHGLKYHKKDSAPKVIVRANLMNDGMVEVEVEDDGIGIEKDHFGEVFTMFRRLHSRSEYQGTGIGLAVCKRIVERHGGEIGVESVAGAGSTFSFTIPAARVQGNNKKEVGVNE